MNNSNEGKELCGGCGRGCTVDALSCMRGRALHGQLTEEEMEAEGLSEHHGHHESGHGHPDFGEPRTDDEKIIFAIRRMGHRMHHGEEMPDFSKLSDNEKKTLADLLLKLVPQEPDGRNRR